MILRKPLNFANLTLVMSKIVDATNTQSKLISDLFEVGAHFGFGKSRRHPSVSDFIFGSKNKTDIFDLEKTSQTLEKAIEFVKKLASGKGTLLFVGGKSEAKEAVKKAAERLNHFFVGLVNLTSLPKAIFIVDPRKEETALREAVQLKIPVIALCGSDNKISGIDYPIIGNDSARKSIEYFVEAIKEAYKE